MIHTTVEARWTKREKESNKHRDSSPNESEKKKKKNFNKPNRLRNGRRKKSNEKEEKIQIWQIIFINKGTKMKDNGKWSKKKAQKISQNTGK